MKRIALALLSLVFGLFLTENLPVKAGQGAVDEAQLKAGETVYKKTCLQCHTPGGKSPIPPMNLADDEWARVKSFDDMIQVISDGIADTAMQPFKEKLSEKEILSVAVYVSTFSKTAPRPTSGAGGSASKSQTSKPSQNKEKQEMQESRDEKPEKSAP